jgi:hypothetical protein
MHLPLILHAIAVIILSFCLIMKIKKITYSNTLMLAGVAFQVAGGLASFFKW